MPRFFGEVLVTSGEIDHGQLQEALDLCDQINLRVGEIGVREGWMDIGQVKAVLERQRSSGRRFGETAEALGFITESQLQVMVHQRTTSHLYIGEALIQLGSLTRSQLEAQLESYKAEVAEFSKQNQVPVEVTRIPIAAKVLEALPRIAIRIGRLQILTRWGPEWMDQPDLLYRSWIQVESTPNLAIGIAASHRLAEQIAAATLFCDFEEIEPDDLDQSLGEFLNLVVGSAKDTLAAEDDSIRFSLARTDDFPSEGYGLYLVTNWGPGCLVIQHGPTQGSVAAPDSSRSRDEL